jgi:hypothetical protein
MATGAFCLFLHLPEGHLYSDRRDVRTTGEEKKARVRGLFTLTLGSAQYLARLARVSDCAPAV